MATDMQKKTFGEKLAERTCIFCGAPKTEDNRCNYCGCSYLDEEHFDEILFEPSDDYLIIFEAEKLSVDDARFEAVCEYKYYNALRKWFDSEFDQHHCIQQSKRKVMIHYNERKIIIDGAFISMIATPAFDTNTDMKLHKVHCQIVYDYFYILEK